jgi:hypothetical protein
MLMNNKRNSLFGLLDGNMRRYAVKEGEVDATQIEYCQAVYPALFGPKGLADTLGPTWQMVHDPRFTVMEESFIREMQVSNGDSGLRTVEEGVLVQDANGFFTGGDKSLETYSEILGEGRHYISTLRSMALLRTAEELYGVERTFFVPEEHLYPGIFIAGAAPETVTVKGEPVPYASLTAEELAKAGLLSLDERQAVQNLTALDMRSENTKLNPYNVKTWGDLELWALIRNENKNYFDRTGQPNWLAKVMFKLLRSDLLGLISDYAEIANIQEYFVLGSDGELWEADKHGEETHRVWAEVELLEKALNYRAELRSTAVQVLNNFGLKTHVDKLTDVEKDTLLALLFGSGLTYPQDKAEMASKILGFLQGVEASGSTLEERQDQQLSTARETAQRIVGGLRTGDIAPITRQTDGMVETGADVSSSTLFGEQLAMIHTAIDQLVVAAIAHFVFLVDAVSPTLSLQKFFQAFSLAVYQWEPGMEKDRKETLLQHVRESIPAVITEYPGGYTPEVAFSMSHMLIQCLSLANLDVLNESEEAAWILELYQFTASLADYRNGVKPVPQTEEEFQVILGQAAKFLPITQPEA